MLDEETDVRADGRVQSHFVWYLEAMEELGADCAPIRALVESIQDGTSLGKALEASDLPPAAKTFGSATAAVLERPIHIRAAVFLHGREEIIPEMFLPIVEHLDREGVACTALRDYLQRHVEIDQGEHGPLAEQMLSRLHRGDPILQAEAQAAALDALAVRQQLWDAIADATDY